MFRELAARRGLALAVEADHHDGLLLEGQVAGAAQDVHEFVVDDADHVFSVAHPGRGTLREGAALDAFGERQHELHLDIGLDEGALDVADRVLDEGRVHVPGVGDLLEGAAKRVAQVLQDHLR